MEIRSGGLDDPQVQDLLQLHLFHARRETAPGSAHALDLEGLRAPEVSFWSAWEGDRLLGFAALKRIEPDHFEVKSMHTVSESRRLGVASELLRHLISSARARGGASLSLETGTWSYFQPAVALYRKHGFVECEPFGAYRHDPNSLFMTLRI